jgi:hypothetical protein
MRASLVLLLLVCSETFLWQHGHGYHTGAPSSSCRNMLPAHGYEASSEPSPYVITVHANSYGPLDQIEVTIHSSLPNATFKGFLLTAKAVSGSSAGQMVGTFITPARHTLMNRACDRKAVTHSIHRVRSTVTAKWRAPYRPVGPVVFHASVVQRMSLYWVDVQSTPLPPSQWWRGQFVGCRNLVNRHNMAYQTTPLMRIFLLFLLICHKTSNYVDAESKLLILVTVRHVTGNKMSLTVCVTAPPCLLWGYMPCCPVYTNSNSQFHFHVLASDVINSLP